MSFLHFQDALQVPLLLRKLHRMRYCIIAAMAGDTSQDLKTGYIVGATPYLQQIGELIGSIASGLAIGGVLYLLNAAWGYGSTESYGYSSAYAPTNRSDMPFLHK